MSKISHLTYSEESELSLFPTGKFRGSHDFVLELGLLGTLKNKKGKKKRRKKLMLQNQFC